MELPYEMQLAILFMINCNFFKLWCVIVCIYIYIFSARTSRYGNVFVNIATPTDVLHITGLEPGKISTGLKLTISIWMIFDIHAFVQSHKIK